MTPTPAAAARDPRHLYNVEKFLTRSVVPAMRHAPLPDGDLWRQMVDWKAGDFVPGYSPNQEAMAAAIWLHLEPTTGRPVAFRLVDDEVTGKELFHRKEPLSNTYQHWKTAAVLAIYNWALNNGDQALADTCRIWLRATWALNALGAAPGPDRNAQKGIFRWRYTGPWVPSAGMRSTPQHYNTAAMGYLLGSAIGMSAQDRGDDWTGEVIRMCGPVGLTASETHALWRLISGVLGTEGAAVAMLAGLKFCEPFHFRRWASGAVLTWHDKNQNGNTADVKASFWERVDGTGEATHLYPYRDAGERHPSIGYCRESEVAGVLVAGAETVEHLDLPEEAPMYDVVIG